MKIYSLDASVILFFFREKESLVAQRVKNILREVKQNKANLYSHQFLFLELANGLRYSCKKQEDALIIYTQIGHLPVKAFELSHKHIQEVIKLSYQLNTTVYDTSYHYLAKILGGIFLTCDKEYYKKARKISDIELLAD